MTEPPAWEPPTGREPATGPASGWGTAPGWSPQPSWSPPPPPAQPGVVPLRPLGVGEILDGAFRTVRRHPKATLGLAALATAVQLALSLLLTAGSGPDLVASVQLRSGLPLRSGLSAGNLLSLPISAAIGGVLTALVSVITSDAVLGRATGALPAWRRVRPLLWRLLAVGVIVTVGPFLALLLLVVPGVFLWGAWALAVPALALEHTGVGGALRRSWRLAVPDWWRVWGIRVLSVLLGGLVSLILTVPAIAYGAASLFSANQTSGDIGVGPTVAIVLISAVASVVVAPFLAAVLALLYIDRRMRAEGLDVTLARSLRP